MQNLLIKVLTAFAAVRASADRGAVAAEYGVLIAGIVVAVSVAALALGARIGNLFDSVLP
jgi:Flp pilus assembly pilin Flp